MSPKAAVIQPRSSGSRVAGARLGVRTSVAILTSVGVELGPGDGAREVRVSATRGNRRADNSGFTAVTAMTGVGVWM